MENRAVLVFPYHWQIMNTQEQGNYWKKDHLLQYPNYSQMKHFHLQWQFMMIKIIYLI